MEHRRYVPYSAAHYAGNLVDGAWGLGLFGDVATELCIRHRRRRGAVRVLQRRPVPGARCTPGDTVVATATLTRVGTRSRQMDFELLVVARGEVDGSGSAAAILATPLVATTATGTVVVPPRLDQ